MHSALALSLLVGALYGVSASEIDEKCTNFALKPTGHVYTADCLKDDGVTRISSAVYLKNKFTNSNGVVQWKANGGYFDSCQYCTLSGSTTLSCACQTAGSVANNPTYNNSTLDLSEHIHVVDGHLLYDLAGPQTAPADAPEAVPKYVSWGLGGNSTAYHCISGVNGKCYLSCSASATLDDVAFNGDLPQTCYVPTTRDFLDKIQFDILKLSTTGGWEAYGYDNAKCIGEPVVQLGSSDWNQCRDANQWVYGVKINPLFNYNYAV